ncbi:glutamate-cysteine ligase family protein [Nonomuraea rubra]|uniref:glutamate-cysteine ligase family protein n=1 Tax=Nonomuraea rubra TaxID=46180 RepID=UPI0031E7F617
MTVPSPAREPVTVTTPFDPVRPLMGVEEEYLVVDPRTREVVPRAGQVVRRAAEELGEQVCTEITRFQVEAKTPPCAEPAGLERELRRMRDAVAAAARAEGLAVVASGTPVLGEAVPPPHHRGLPLRPRHRELPGAPRRAGHLRRSRPRAPARPGAGAAGVQPPAAVAARP